MTRTVLGTSLAPDELMAQDRDPVSEDDRAGVAAALFAQLTARQRMVSVWITAGFSNAEITGHLGVTQQDVSDALADIARLVRCMRL